MLGMTDLGPGNKNASAWTEMDFGDNGAEIAGTAENAGSTYQCWYNTICQVLCY